MRPLRPPPDQRLYALVVQKMRPVIATVTSLAVVGALVALQLKSKSRLSEPRREPVPDHARLVAPRPPTRGRKTGPDFVVALSATLVVAGSFIGLWLMYNATLPEPVDAPDPGSVNVYFDRPGISAYIDATVETIETEDPVRGSVADIIGINVNLVDQVPEIPIEYSFVVSGSAMLATNYPTGLEMPVDASGCPETTRSPGLRCQLVKGAPESVFAVDEAKFPVYVIQGRIVPDADGNATQYVQFPTVGRTVVDRGPSREFRLPKFGTTGLPEELRDDFTAIVDGYDDLYVPGYLAVEVQYDYLGPSERVEGVEPEPISRSPLTWGGTAARSVEASGTIVDALEERGADRSIFFYGVLAGAAASFVPTVGTLWWRVLRPGLARLKRRYTIGK